MALAWHCVTESPQGAEEGLRMIAPRVFLLDLSIYLCPQEINCQQLVFCRFSLRVKYEHLQVVYFCFVELWQLLKGMLTKHYPGTGMNEILFGGFLSSRGETF